MNVSQLKIFILLLPVNKRIAHIGSRLVFIRVLHLAFLKLKNAVLSVYELE